MCHNEDNLIWGTLCSRMCVGILKEKDLGADLNKSGQERWADGLVGGGAYGESKWRKRGGVQVQGGRGKKHVLIHCRMNYSCGNSELRRRRRAAVVMHICQAVGKKDKCPYIITPCRLMQQLPNLTAGKSAALHHLYI